MQRSRDQHERIWSRISEGRSSSPLLVLVLVLVLALVLVLVLVLGLLPTSVAVFVGSTCASTCSCSCLEDGIARNRVGKSSRKGLCE